jgi:DNA-binding HxlR family transcriptional regulator
VTGGGRDFSVPASLTRHARCRPGRRPRSATRLNTALRLPDGVAVATDCSMNAQEDERSPSTEEGRVLLSARASLLVRLIMGRWTYNVPGELSEGGRRYQDLHDALGGISHKVLTYTLRRAELDGLVMRHVDAGRVETATLYRLTELGSRARGQCGHLRSGTSLGPLVIGDQCRRPDACGLRRGGLPAHSERTGSQRFRPSENVSPYRRFNRADNWAKLPG